MIVIVGAGLSGLCTGYKLKEQGVPFKIVEARGRTGGRIHTVNDSSGTPVELGATWFGDQHTYLKELLNELGLTYFDQYMEGTSLYQPFANSPASAIPMPAQQSSYRISNGTTSLIDALVAKVGMGNVNLNQKVESIEFLGDSVLVKAGHHLYKASKVVLSLPPKLWQSQIEFIPALPDQLTDIATTTHTWMEDSIKVALTFERPFWRQKRLSGAVFSNSGPITELYDHCDSSDNKYALCGFINSNFSRLTETERKQLVLGQLMQVFGDDISQYLEYHEKVWGEDRNTSTKSETALLPHQNNGNRIYQNSYFDNRLIISSSEASPAYPGYMEGAVVAGMRAWKKIESETQFTSS